MSGRSSEFDRTRNREVLGRESGRLRKNVEMLFAHTSAFLSWTTAAARPKGVRDEFILVATAQNLRSCGSGRHKFASFVRARIGVGFSPWPGRKPLVIDL